MKKVKSERVCTGQEAGESQYTAKNEDLVEEVMLSMEGEDSWEASVQEVSGMPIVESDSDMSESNDS